MLLDVLSVCRRAAGAGVKAGLAADAKALDRGVGSHADRRVVGVGFGRALRYVLPAALRPGHAGVGAGAVGRPHVRLVDDGRARQQRFQLRLRPGVREQVARLPHRLVPLQHVAVQVIGVDLVRPRELQVQRNLLGRAAVGLGGRADCLADHRVGPDVEAVVVEPDMVGKTGAHRGVKGDGRVGAVGRRHRAVVGLLGGVLDLDADRRDVGDAVRDLGVDTLLGRQRVARRLLAARLAAVLDLRVELGIVGGRLGQDLHLLRRRAVVGILGVGARGHRPVQVHGRHAHDGARRVVAVDRDLLRRAQPQRTPLQIARGQGQVQQGGVGQIQYQQPTV